MNAFCNLKSLFGAAALICAGSLYGEITTNEMANADWGYEIHGLGEKGDEVALVFTNATDKTMTWKPGLDIAGVRYLIVGGGGAGGSGYAASKRDYTTPDMGGGGGGAGAGFEGMVDVSAGDVIPVIVGAGGIGAVSSQGGDGGESSIEAGDQKIVAAGGGGGGRAINSTSLEDSLAAGRAGGCGGGGTVSGKKQKSPKSIQNGGASVDELHGKAGGKGYIFTTNYQLCYGGGGGGITGAGYVGGGSGVTGPRNGGAGLMSSITGEEIVYGGGGGGGGATATLGGDGGAGGGGKGGVGPKTDSPKRSAEKLGCGFPGVDGLGGGGGGGTGYSADYNKEGAFAGGNGGSGVVIIRYLPPAGRVALPVIQPKTYTGETLVADVPPSDGYRVTKNDGGVNVGTYTVTVVLSEGYSWNDGSTEPADVEFEITPAQNVWIDGTPSISKENWLTTDEDPGVLTPGATEFGTPTATIAKDGGAATEFDGMLPIDPGVYVITYAVETSGNWLDPDETTKSVSFTIFNGDVVPPFTVEKGLVSFVEGDEQVVLTISYAVHCEVESDKKVDIYAYYAEDGSDTTNEVKIAKGVALDAVGTGTVPDLKPGVTYWVALGGRGGDTVAPTTEFTTVTVPGPATGLEAAATFTNDPREFVVTGSVTPGLGTTTVYVRWSLNSSALDNLATYTFALGDDGTFEQKVAYENPTDALTWDVAVSNSFSTTTYGPFEWDDAKPASTKTRTDKESVTYTWTGDGDDNLWTNFANWSANRTECFGYPNNVTYATAKFTKDAAVNLNQGTFSLLKQTGLTFSSDIDVCLSNGNIKCEYVTGTDFGAARTTVVLKDVNLTRERVGMPSNATVVFEGNSSVSGMVRPYNVTGVTVIFRNGETTVGKILHGYGADNAFIVDNARLIVSGNPTKDWAMGSVPITFIDGPDRPAQLVTTGSDGWNFKQSFTLEIPAGGRTEPYFQAVKHFTDVEGQYANFTVDVTNWKGGRRIPLVKFTSKAAQTTFATLVEGRKPVAMADGVNVTDKRNARYEWSAADNTLYYKQDSLSGLVLLFK